MSVNVEQHFFARSEGIITAEARTSAARAELRKAKEEEKAARHAEFEEYREYEGDGYGRLFGDIFEIDMKTLVPDQEGYRGLVTGHGPITVIELARVMPISRQIRLKKGETKAVGQVVGYCYHNDGSERLENLLLRMRWNTGEVSLIEYSALCEAIGKDLLT